MSSQGKYIAIGSTGDLQETAAIQTSTGSSNANQIIATNSAGVVDASMMPAGVGVDAISVVASEAIAAGALISLYSNAGVLNVRNADNTTSAKWAQGFSQSAIASSGTGTVILGIGLLTGLTGLTIGADYFLGTTGAIVLGASIPTATNSIVQKVGKAITATEILFLPSPYIIRA